jgi:hypothetical protein
MSWRVHEIENITFLFVVRQQQSYWSGLDCQLFLLFINSTVKPTIIFFQIPFGLPIMCLLDEQVHKESFSVMQMTSNANISDE